MRKTFVVEPLRCLCLILKKNPSTYFWHDYLNLEKFFFYHNHSKIKLLLRRFIYKAKEVRMKRSILCLLVVLCWSSFALSALVEDPDFIDEKGKALKNFKGKCICALSLPQNYLRLVILIRTKHNYSVSSREYKLALVESFHLRVNE